MAYISKEEKKIPINDPTGKWSDLTLLPEWGETYYDVYTVKKHGKWVMLKALKKEFQGLSKYEEMLEKEFDTRYKLSHPNIVMVNDFEEVPGVGRAIITDDVYGYSLRRLIDEKRLTPLIVKRLQTQLLSAMEYIQEHHVVHHPITPDTIIFTEYDENLKLINVGYDQTESLSQQDTADDLRSYGHILEEVLENLPENLPLMRRVAEKCIDSSSPYSSVQDVQLALQKRSSSQVYMLIVSIVLLLAAILILLVK